MKKHLLSFFACSFLAVAANAQSACDTTVYKLGSATYYTLLDDAAGTARSGNCTFVNDDVKPYYGAMYTPVYDNSNYCGVCGSYRTKGNTSNSNC